MKFLQNLTGSPLTSDAGGPDASTPETRIVSLPTYPLPTHPAPRGRFAFWATGGTSVVVTIWVFEETTGAWVKYSSTDVTVTTASSPVVSSDEGIALPAGTKVFMQLGTVTGSVTALGWTYG